MNKRLWRGPTADVEDKHWCRKAEVEQCKQGTSTCCSVVVDGVNVSESGARSTSRRRRRTNTYGTDTSERRESTDADDFPVTLLDIERKLLPFKQHLQLKTTGFYLASSFFVQGKTTLYLRSLKFSTSYHHRFCGTHLIIYLINP